MSRPSSYTQEVADEICKRLAGGETLILICKEEEMPSQSTVFRWAQNNAVFRENYARAREEQADYFAEEILKIADEDPAIVLQRQREGEETIIVDGAAIQHQRLRVDARKWFASKVAPKKYGDRQEIEHSGAVTLETLVTGSRGGG